MNGGAPLGERFDLETLPAQPWKNGGGLTREIASHPPGAGLHAFDWRLSVAEVARDGPFSAFPGIDRVLVLLRGAGMRLLRAGDVHALDRVGAALAFAGETPVEARLVGGPTTDFNVMTRRGRWSTEVAVLDAPTQVARADGLLLLSGSGEWVVGSDDATPLMPWQCLLWRQAVGALHVQPRQTSARPWLLVVRLCHDRS